MTFALTKPNMKPHQPAPPSPISADASETSKPARRTQQSRSKDAQGRLLKAAVQVLLDKGYSGFSTKEVVDRAGLSKGALVHHFTNKADLVVAATAAVYEEALLRGQAVAKSESARRNPLKGYIADCASVYFEWPFVAALEIVVVARTDQALMDRIAPVIANYRTMTDELWTSVLVESGMPKQKAIRLLKLSLNVVRGMALGELWNQDQDHSDREKALSEWAKIATQLFVSEQKRP